jgi:hypothetical protein
MTPQPKKEAAPREPLVLSAGNIRSLADRLEAHADAVGRLQPAFAADLRAMARLARHAVRVGWIITSVAVQ